MVVMLVARYRAKGYIKKFPYNNELASVTLFIGSESTKKYIDIASQIDDYK